MHDERHLDADGALALAPPPLGARPTPADKDRPIVAGAIAAGATHLITGDARHFGAYFGKRIAGILVLTPADYLRGGR